MDLDFRVGLAEATVGLAYECKLQIRSYAALGRRQRVPNAHARLIGLLTWRALRLNNPGENTGKVTRK